MYLHTYTYNILQGPHRGDRQRDAEARGGLRRGDGTVGNRHRAQMSEVELLEPILLLNLDKQLPVEQFEAAVPQSAVPSPPSLEDGQKPLTVGFWFSLGHSTALIYIMVYYVLCIPIVYYYVIVL